jgi:Ser/Thr protein kinase RdoA (MazF antagonist)
LPNNNIQHITAAFGLGPCQVEPITEGLINRTYKATDSTGRSYIVQQINTTIFPNPQHVQENFVIISKILQPYYLVPQLVPTYENALYLQHEGEAWRCFTFVENSYTPSGTVNEDLAYTTAKCFGHFTALLSTSKPGLHTILPRFHHLGWRAKQLVEAKAQATPHRLKLAQPCLSKLDEYDYLLRHFALWQANPKHYPQRILHHDTKPTNILYDKATHQVLCPIDLDTTQPGLFFSDLGDMIRTLAPSHEENDIHFDDIEVRPMYLQALMQGYMDTTHTLWTPHEREALSLSGKVLLYMQAIRFLADFLNNDSYYQTRYDLHNLHRAINQITVLERLSQIS